MRLNSYERKVQIHNLYVKEISLNWDTDSSVELFGSLEYLITGCTKKYMNFTPIKLSYFPLIVIFEVDSS